MIRPAFRPLSRPSSRPNTPHDPLPTSRALLLPGPMASMASSSGDVRDAPPHLGLDVVSHIVRICFDHHGLVEEIGTIQIGQLRRNLRLTCRAWRELADAEATTVQLKVGGHRHRTS